jgi:gliding motility-associated-like protein
MSKLKSIVLCIIILFTVDVSKAQYVINGNAVSNSCNCYTLTQAVNTQSGSVWNSNLINLSQPFDFKFDVNLGCKDNDGADGMAFVLQPISTTVGTSGGGMGYQGITPSLGVLLDTYQNTGDADPTYDHISINTNGNINHSATNNLAGPTQIINNVNNAEDCAWHVLRITWNPGTQLLTAYIDDVQRVQANVNLINTIFFGNPMVYWGFTAATGGLNNEHKFCVKNTPSITHNFTSDTVCTLTSSVNFIGQGNSNSSLPIIEHYWNMGDGTTYNTQNVSHPLLAGSIYNVKYISKTIDGCWSDTARKTITVARSGSVALNVSNTCVGDTVFLMGFIALNQVDGTITHIYTVDNINVNTASNGIHYVLNLAPGNHTATFNITTSYGCVSNIATVNFQVIAKPPNVTINANDGCEGSVITFSSSETNSAYNYEWFINGAPSGNTSTITPNLTAGTYTIKHLIKNSNGCKSDTATKIIIIHPKPIATLIVNDTCLGNPTLFNSTNTNTNYNYHWIVDGNVIIQNTPSFTQMFPLGLHQVKHYIIGLGGCVSDTAYDSFEVLAKPATPIANVFNLCQNQNANFSITNPIVGIQYFWIIDNAAAIQTNTVTSNFSSGNHTIKIFAKNNSSCVSDTAYYNFSVTPTASAQFNVNDECGEKQITIQGAAAAQHQWFINGVLDNSNQSFTKLFAAGTYTVMHIVSNGNNNCNDTVTKIFTVLAKPNISASAPTVCIGQPSQFTSTINNGPIANLTYQWFFPDGSQSAIANPSITMNSIGNYQAKLVVKNGSCNSDTLRTNYIVYKPYVFAGNDTLVPRNQSFVLNGNADAGTYSWTPSNIFTNANTLTPTGTLANNQICVLTLTTNGCTVADSLLVTVYDGVKIYVPTAFTPNNDGINDALQPIYLGIKELKYFRVFNRWGQIVSEVKNNLQTGWNGGFQGKPQPIGTYIYVISAVDYLGNTVFEKGVTTLIR